MSIATVQALQNEGPRVGIMGGTFDPIHKGHLAIAASVADQLALEEVLFIPTGNPSFKLDLQVTDAHVRADMVAQAIAHDARFSVDRREVERDGVTYSVDTLRELHAERPDAQFFFIMGADAARTIVHWKSAQEVAQLCTIVAVSRPGFDDQEVMQALQQSPINFDVFFVEVAPLDISSTHIRELIAQGQSVSELVPETVERYIKEHGLYW